MDGGDEPSEAERGSNGGDERSEIPGVNRYDEETETPAADIKVKPRETAA